MERELSIPLAAPTLLLAMYQQSPFVTTQKIRPPGLFTLWERALASCQVLLKTIVPTTANLLLRRPSHAIATRLLHTMANPKSNTAGAN